MISNQGPHSSSAALNCPWGSFRVAVTVQRSRTSNQRSMLSTFGNPTALVIEWALAIKLIRTIKLICNQYPEQFSTYKQRYIFYLPVRLAVSPRALERSAVIGSHDWSTIRFAIRLSGGWCKDKSFIRNHSPVFEGQVANQRVSRR